MILVHDRSGLSHSCKAEERNEHFNKIQRIKMFRVVIGDVCFLRGDRLHHINSAVVRFLSVRVISIIKSSVQKFEGCG